MAETATPVKVASLTNVSMLAAGRYHTCALQGNVMKCWGSDAYGQIANGGTDSNTPVSQGSFSIDAIAAGDHHTCAVVTGGQLDCWGYNGFGQLGTNDLVDRPSPAQVPSLSGVTAVTAAGQGTCARVGTQNYCWGDGINGDLADGTSHELTTPELIGALDNMTVVRGRHGGCAIDALQQLQCWGYGTLLANGDLSTAQPQLVDLACHR